MKTCKCDLISVAVGLSNAVVVEPASLSLDEKEKKQIREDLNTFMAPHGIKIDKKWVMEFKNPKRVKLIKLKDAVGKPMSQCLPTGKDASKIGAVLVEVQMFLKVHAINTKRQKAGKPTVDSIWLSPKGWFS